MNNSLFLFQSYKQSGPGWNQSLTKQALTRTGQTVKISSVIPPIGLSNQKHGPLCYDD